MNLFKLLYSFKFSLGDFAKQTRIQLPIVILHLIKNLVREVVDLILIPFVENWECVCSHKTLGHNIKKLYQSNMTKNKRLEQKISLNFLKALLYDLYHPFEP